MQLKDVYFLGLVLIIGDILGVRLEHNVTSDESPRSVQKNISKAANNSYLNEFVEDNFQFQVIWQNENFNLYLDRKFEFKPPIRRAPFPSVGEPWPLPKHYRFQKERVLNLKKSTFKISVLNYSCDVLTEAIKRYKKIIENHIPEEHYEFLYNFNEKTFVSHKRQEEAKYNHVTTMADLEIFVRENDCGYPHIDMKESYKLTVKESVTKLIADQVWGALRGLETFSQLLFRKRDTDLIYAKETEIEDEPRFPHRGILMDTSRHYIHKFAIKNVLDGMAYNKMNVLHWHIVDDASFPYQSEVFPKLSEKGAFHPALVYTIKDIKEIVEYARLRGIRVIPEFDSPGHTLSWFGYPDIKSTCYVRNTPLHGPLGPINPAQDKTYSFMSKLFSEIFNVFPDTFVHLGGDELRNTCWATNPQITAYLQEHGGIPAAEASKNAANYINMAIGYYFKRLIATLKTAASDKKTKKSFILWEDVLKNTEEVPSDSVLQVWIGGQHNVRDLNEKGYRALYSSCWYLDRYKRQPTWPDYYMCDPSPYASETEEEGKLLGGEACLWAEYITTDTLMTFMWPRASAPAERLWSPKITTNLVNAQRRLQEQRCRMIYRGLQTGHISGPDYCLRPRDGPLGGTSLDNSSVIRVQEIAGSLNLADEQKVSLLVFSSKHHYGPFQSIFLGVFGVFLMILAAKIWRKKARGLGLCPKFV